MFTVVKNQRFVMSLVVLLVASLIAGCAGATAPAAAPTATPAGRPTRSPRRRMFRRCLPVRFLRRVARRPRVIITPTLANSIIAYATASSEHTSAFDLYLPEGTGPFPLVVNIHPGGFFDGL